MAQGYYKEVTQLLRQNNWELLRQAKGSHEVWWCPATNARTVIPNPLKTKHLANSILKFAGVEKKF